MWGKKKLEYFEKTDKVSDEFRFRVCQDKRIIFIMRKIATNL